nr:PH domain-containing protein [Neobacillus sp. Marseille-Q6967]
MRVYSKKGIITGVLLWGAIIFMWYTVIFENQDSWEKTIDSAIIFIFPTVFVSWLWFGTYYEIEGSKLKIVAGPFKETVDIMKIKRIKRTRNPLSSAALAMNRLQIDHGKWDFTLISPKDEEKFCHILKEINPEIEVNL